VGVTVVLASTVRLHVPIPVQRPDHPAKVTPAAGSAVNTTCFPLAKLALQVPGQLIPAGLLVTVPTPVPALCTVSLKYTVVELNVAVTDFAAFTEIVHVEELPLQAPDHPANLEPDLGVSISLTDVPLLSFALHAVPQLMAEGLLVIVPAPAPDIFTVSGYDVVASGVTFARLVWPCSPHMARNGTRQQALPKTDLITDITPPADSPMNSMQSCRRRLSAGEEILTVT
jgi:hypothetical protein